MKFREFWKKRGQQLADFELIITGDIDIPTGVYSNNAVGST